jgi:hypothetical protein
LVRFACEKKPVLLFPVIILELVKLFSILWATSCITNCTLSSSELALFGPKYLINKLLNFYTLLLILHTFSFSLIYFLPNINESTGQWRGPENHESGRCGHSMYIPSYVCTWVCTFV